MSSRTRPPQAMTIRFILAALLAVLAVPLASAQTSSTPTLAELKLPDCARYCLSNIVGQSSCGIDDQACMCADTKLQDKITACVKSGCSIKESLYTKNATSILCGFEIRDERSTLNVVAIILGALSALFVALRIFSKLYISGSLSIDDWFIIATLAFGIPDTVLIVVGLTANGLGRDLWTLEGDSITQFGLYMYVVQIMYAARVALLKMSLLFFYLRIFPNKRIRQLLWGTVVLNAGYGVAFCFAAAFVCQPMSFFWERWDGEHTSGKCIDINAVAWANAGVSIIVDIWMLALPLSQLGQLKLHWKKKIGVAIMFIIGTFVTIMSILRLQSLVTFANSDNPTWDNWDVVKWSTIEINVGVICACLPPLRVLLLRAFPRLGGSTNSYPSQMNENDGPGGWRKPGGPHHGGGGGIALDSKVPIASHSRQRSKAMGVESTAERGSVLLDRDEAASRNGIQYQVSYTVSYAERETDDETLVRGGTSSSSHDFDGMPARRGGSPGGGFGGGFSSVPGTPSDVQRTHSMSRSQSHHRNYSRPRPRGDTRGSISRSNSVSAMGSRERLNPDDVGPLSPGPVVL